jgi:hypothetical protein
VLPSDLPLLVHGPSRDPSSSARPPASSSGRFLTGSVRVAPSQSRLASQAAAHALAARQQREAHDSHEQIVAWEAMRAAESVREERRRRIKARRAMSPAEAEADRKLEEWQERQAEVARVTRAHSSHLIAASRPFAPSPSPEEKSDAPMTIHDGGAEVLTFGQFRFVDRPDSSASQTRWTMPHDGSIGGSLPPHPLEARTPSRSPSPLPPGFTYHQATAPGTRHGREELGSTHRPWTVNGAPALARDDGRMRAQGETRARTGWMQRMRIARGTAISVRPGTHDPTIARDALGQFAYERGQSTSSSSEHAHLVASHPPLLPASRGTFSRAGMASRGPSRDAPSGSRYPSHDGSHARHISPPRGVPVSLPLMTPPAAPVQSFNVPPTARQDINAALRGTLVAPRFLAPSTTSTALADHRPRTSSFDLRHPPPRPSLPKLSATATFVPLHTAAMRVDVSGMAGQYPSGSTSARDTLTSKSPANRDGAKTSRDRPSPRITPKPSAHAF